MLQPAPLASRARMWLALVVLSSIGPFAGCDADDVVAPVPTAPTVEGAVEGAVTAFTTGEPIAGANVSIGDVTVTTGPDGRFVLIDVTPGPATLRCIAAGFADFEAAITVASGSIRFRNITLRRLELFEFGDFALHVSATVPTIRGVLLALGGPDTRGFASDGPFGAPAPEVEATLRALGQKFRTLAASHGLAVLGTSLAAMPNSPDSDQLLLDAVQKAAATSGHPELANAPLLLYGMSGGGPQASGLAARNPGRVAGLFLKVPAGVESLTSGEVLGVPTYLVLAELDAFVDNAALAAAFEANRGAGALWALAMEAGVPHHSLTPAHRELTTHWMSTILALRLPPTSAPLSAIVESSGWLGDPATGVAPWVDYLGDAGSASWFPSQATAEEWGAFVAVRTGVGSVAIDPEDLIIHPGQVASLVAAVRDTSGRWISNPVLTFTSDNENVARVAHDELCLPGCRDWVYVVGVAPGEATVTAEYEGETATATVTVLPASGSG